MGGEQTGVDDGDSIVRQNLMTQAGYAPYCGAEYYHCGCPRMRWDGEQFACWCGYRTNFPADFIARYKAKWRPLPPSTGGDK